MSRIRILSEHLANQIAAGEVVERPASVVKELVENSLDAGATRIDIHVEGSGTTLLRVADNGSGMDGDDVLLCIERHATSKLHEASQLAAITTLGFRGEAIPSIASVSWMTILSRQQNQDLGTRAELRYGALQAIHEDGCGRGTVIEVRHLFGNTPVRKKFLTPTRARCTSQRASRSRKRTRDPGQPIHRCHQHNSGELPISASHLAIQSHTEAKPVRTAAAVHEQPAARREHAW